MDELIRKVDEEISWAGRGSHEGHVISPTDTWSSTVETLPDGRRTITCGRVKCSCGDEWDVGGWPIEWFSALEEN